MKLIQVLLVILAIFAFTAPCFAGNSTNYPNGVTNVNELSPFGELITLDPRKVIVFFEDFQSDVSIAGGSLVEYSGSVADATYTYSPWLITTTEAGAGSNEEVISEVIIDAATAANVLSVTLAAGDNDFSSWQTRNSMFYFQPNKRMWFSTRIYSASTTTTQDSILVGLVPTDTSVITAVDDGVYFAKNDGDAYIDFHVENGGSKTSTSEIASMSGNTWTELAFYYDGVDEIKIFIDGVHRKSSVVTYLPADGAPSDRLKPTFCFQNGEAVAHTFWIDYICVIQER